MFSPSLMSRFRSEEQPIARLNGHGTGTATPLHVFHWTGSFTEFLDTLKLAQKDDSPSGRYFARFAREFPNAGREWAGVYNQSQADILETGLCASAVADFQKHKAELETKLTRATPILSPIGSSFSVGRIIMGHPKAALIRPKTKLPILSLEFSLRTLARVSPATIAERISKIARAAWEYKAIGGIVNLSISYVHLFDTPQEFNGVKHHALINTIKLSPVSLGALATAFSVQAYRALSMPLSMALCQSGHVPASQWHHPRIKRLDGTRDDLATLAAAGIK